jgi:hypothetical protein
MFRPPVSWPSSSVTPGRASSPMTTCRVAGCGSTSAVQRGGAQIVVEVTSTAVWSIGRARVARVALPAVRT